MDSLVSLLPNFSVRWDEWSTLFFYLVGGIGIAIGVYAIAYFETFADKIRFLILHIVFSGAMLGLVLFDHLLAMFICWEITSILSFALISFKYADEKVKKGAIQAGLITGAGGLALLAGILMLMGEGITTVTQLVGTPLQSLESGQAIAWCLTLGALTKSAQFPFHFWLPGAMTAPTPASAFLHSATMVKAGVYLLYLTAGAWEGILHLPDLMLVCGLVTFSWGALTCVMQRDLKAILAGTTIANLGLMVAMITNPFEGARALVPGLVIAHALYKAGLFMFAGYVEHAAHSRDVVLTAGLKSKLGQVIGWILALASVGVPGSMAFVAKLGFGAELPWKIAVSLAFVLLSLGGWLVCVYPFQGRQAKVAKDDSHHWGLAIIPGMFGLISFGLPFWLQDSPLIPSWTLPETVLPVLSALLVMALVRVWSPAAANSLLIRLRVPQGSKLFDKGWNFILDLGRMMEPFWYQPSVSHGLQWLFVIWLVGVWWWFPAHLAPAGFDWEQGYGFLLVLSAMIVIGVWLLVRASTPMQGVIYLGLVGYALALVFAYLGAPDLSITQFCVESLTVIVFVALLRGLPKAPSAASSVWVVLLSVVGGGVIGYLSWAGSVQRVPSLITQYYLENSLVQAFGRNVVNVILVDFRGLDTLGEISVVAIASMGVFLLRQRQKLGRKT